MAVDVNAGHLAAVMLDRSGNPVGAPCTVPLDLAGVAASVRDGRLRSAISALLRLAKRHGGQAVVVEDLDFADARDQGPLHGPSGIMITARPELTVRLPAPTRN